MSDQGQVSLASLLGERKPCPSLREVRYAWLLGSPLRGSLTCLVAPLDRRRITDEKCLVGRAVGREERELGGGRAAGRIGVMDGQLRGVLITKFYAILTYLLPP